MSSNSRYMTFNPTNRFSQPTEEVAQRLTSVWLLESCCGSCCCPWKRRTSKKSDDKFKDTRSEENDNSRVINDNDDLAQNIELNSYHQPLNIIKNSNQEKNFASDSSDDYQENRNNSSEDDEEEEKERNSSTKEELLTKNVESKENNSDEKSVAKKIDSIFKTNKKFLRKFSLDIGNEKQKNVPIFRKYSLADDVEPNGSPIFKRCVSFKHKKQNSENSSNFMTESEIDENEEIGNSAEKVRNKIKEMKNKREEAKNNDEEFENKLEDLKEENSSEDEETKGLFDSDTDSEDYKDFFEFADNLSFDDFNSQQDDRKLSIEKRNSRMKILPKNGILSVLPNVQEIEEEIGNSSGIIYFYSILTS